MYSLWWLSSEGTTSTCQLHVFTCLVVSTPTIDVDIALLHELAEVRKSLGRVYFGHVDSTQGS